MKSENFDLETTKLAIQIINEMAVINDEICIRCGICSKTCPIESLNIAEIESATA